MTNADRGLWHPIYGELKLNWGWLLALGILMVVLGVIGLGMSYALTLVAVIYFGVLAIIAGIAQLIDAWRCKGWKSIVWHVLIGLLYVGAGLVMIFMPVEAAFWLTLLLAAALIVIGVFRVIMAFQIEAGSGARVWVIASGLISIVLGILIYSVVQPPTAEMLATPEGVQTWVREWGWVIGMLVAIDFIVHGAALISIAFAARAAQDGSSSGRAAARSA